MQKLRSKHTRGIADLITACRSAVHAFLKFSLSVVYSIAVGSGTVVCTPVLAR